MPRQIRRQTLWDSDRPVREDLFGIDRLEDHARHLAAAQTVLPRRVRGQTLNRRLDSNAAALLAAYGVLAAAIDAGRPITPAAEWLVDNYHVIERQVRDINTDLPHGYYRQLPKLAAGPFAGYPRVFGLAWAFVAHTDSHFDPELLHRFLRAYQEVQPLTIGELWAVSMTLRIVLVENLRRLAQRIISSRAARQQADVVADRMLGTGGLPPEPLPVLLAELATTRLSNAFAVQLIHRLRDQDPRTTPVLDWLHQRLSAGGVNADTAVQDVHRDQGASNVTVRNIITSLRMIADVDWTDLVERSSLADAVLSAGTQFAMMDFATRTLYRSAIEDLARGSRLAELDIARAAAKAALSSAPDSLAADPGYHLLAGGLRAFERALGYRPKLRQWPARVSHTLGIGSYALAIAIATAILLALPLLAIGAAGLGTPWLAVLAVLGAIPAIDAAFALTNRLLTASYSATLLPGLELRDGVPAHLRTMVAVPVMLTSAEAIATQIERLEVHHLASPEGELYFALLSDWTDAPEASSQTDADLLDAAGTGIARLNRRYPPAAAGPRFLLLHRHRVWSETEGCWIAWERKRGKLHELNRLLRGAAATTFIDTAAGPPQVPAGVRYVVTIDADTRLPRDTIRRLIGKMAHPLNRPRFDPACRRVVEGYAVLQPRVTPSLPVGREGSLFQRIFSSVSGIDPYASAVSDVYQDLFGEGSYAGKGIYDVDAFEAALAGRVPDGALLSHDLFEGVFARAGLASDVEVVEEYPSRYDAGALRHHRWARGDWQLLPWIFGGGPAVADGAGPPAMPMIGRWKMIDNLRRSLSAPAAVASLLAGWMMPFHAALIWTLFVVATLMLPTLIPVIAAVPPRRVGVTLSSHLRALGGDVRLAAKLSLLQLTLLAHQAWLMSDAVLRTLWRLRVSRRHLLQWTPAAQAVIGRAPSLGAYYRWMGGAIAIAAAAPLPALAAGGGNWRLALPFVLLWLASPAVARRVSLPPRGGPSETISQANTLALRRTARRTWRYFETFVTPLDHMLPPDNFQEDPVPVVAHRTSPTNIGLYLLSVAAAQDFGWIATGTAITRLEATMATMAGLERFRGHFYNWYDTRDLRPLEPPYVSTVDSGNLAGHLIALANACREWQGQTFNAALCRAGLGDALGLLRAEMLPLRESTGPLADSWRQLDTGLLHLAQSAQLLPASVAEAAAHLAGLAGQAAGLDGPARALAAGGWGGGGDGLLFWLQAAQDTIASHRADLAGGGATALQARLHLLEDAARAMALAMEFGFLLEPERKLLAIGYRVPEAALDSNCYDLLASEARLASFVAIAKGDIPARHWFRLGRAVTPCGAGAALISWSGSMFEYLMPSLVMRAPEGSLLAQTNRLIVQQQIDYATGFGLPWGISESAYNARDLEFTYQYSNFGVPGLGLKRGLGSGRTIAPYATALAAMVDPRAACANLVRLAEVGGSARYGFYEALDYTPGRLPHGQTVAIVRAFMAHHQGMTIVAIATALFEGAMRRRFHTEPMIQATELLLQERTPRDVAIVHPWAAEVSASALPGIDIPDGVRHYSSPAQPSPATLLLSNGRYTTMLTAAGSGYSRWGEFALSRWREDATCDDYGSYIFLRDVRTSAVWSAGWQPAGVEPDSYAVAFEEDRACFTRRDGTLTTAMDVLISAEDDAEVRRITLTNSGVRTREIDVTSYAELALAPQSADMAHQAFSKLFVQTEYHAGCRAILATRRRRAPGEPEIWVAHLAVTNAEAPGLTEFETSRAKFLGRGNTIRTAAALQGGAALSSTAGSVLDPVFSLRQRVRVAPGAVVQIAFWTIAASSRQALLDAVDTHRDLTAYDRAATLTWTQARVQLHHLSIGPGDAALYQRLGSHLLYCNRALRPHSLTIQRGTGVQSGLWAHGISGDLPILLLRIADIEYLDIAAELLHAHEYWLM